MRIGRSIPVSLAGLAALVALCVTIALPATQKGPRAEPAAGRPRGDADIQGTIEQAVDAVVRQDVGAGERFQALRQLALGRRDEVLLQLALYLSLSTGTERSMAGALILQRLEFTPEEKLDVALPNLASADPALRGVLTELLGTIDRAEGGEPDFRLYEARIMKGRLSPPPALIRYIYEVSPDAALRSMERVYGTVGAGATIEALKEILSRRDASTAWSARDLAQARAALEALGADPAWWRRLYVASLLRRDPELATPALTDRLRNDSNHLVRDTLAP